MENKQTAVEWLVEQITKHTWYDDEGFGHVSVSILDIKQAKEMEKEQIEDAYFIGGHDIKNNRYRGMHEYYEEKYGGNKWNQKKKQRS